MPTSETEQLQDNLLRAAISLITHEGAPGHSFLVPLPGGAKLGIELDFLAASEPQSGRTTAP